jgi:hypothetical protein
LLCVLQSWFQFPSIQQQVVKTTLCWQSWVRVFFHLSNSIFLPLYVWYDRYTWHPATWGHQNSGNALSIVSVSTAEQLLASEEVLSPMLLVRLLLIR